jgi:hypothetical protein
MDDFLGEAKIDACDACYQRTFAIGPASVTATVRWLAEFDVESAQKVDAAMLPGGEGGLVLSSARPRCEDVQCEAPIRRDIVPHVNDEATTVIGRIFEAAWLHSPEMQAALCQIALNEAASTTYVPETGEITVGAVGMHAAIIANNLLWQVNPSSKPLPNVPAGSIPLASAWSLDVLERTLKEAGSDSSPAEKFEVSSGDLLALHVLCRGLQKVSDFASKYVPPPPVRQTQRSSMAPIWAAIAGAAAMLVLAIAARSFLPLIGLVICAVFGWRAWEKSRFVIEIPVPGLDWPQRLHAAAGDSSYQQILDRLRRCDLITHAPGFCADTPVAEPARLAGVLRAVWLAPGGRVLLPRFVHDLARPLSADNDGALRLAVLGEELLAQDCRGEGRALVAGVVAELIAAKANKTISWDVLGTEGTLTFQEAERNASAPRFLAALFRRAAAFQDVCQQRSTPDERFLTTCDEAARRFMAELPIGEPGSATVFVRCLDYMTRGGIANAIFTPGSGCTVEGMLKRTEELWKDHERLPDDAVRAACETILERLGSLQLAKARMPVAARSFQSRSSPPNALDYLCLERLFRNSARAGEKRPAGLPAPFRGDWWQAPAGPRGLEGSNPALAGAPSFRDVARGAARWDMNLEAQNLRRWEGSGYAQIWVKDHNRQWNDADWRALLEMLKRTEYWPMEADAVGMILERLKIKYPARRELKLEAQNLLRWEESGSPRKWVEEHHHQWNDEDWQALLKALEDADFWPMEPDAVGMVLEGLKKTSSNHAALPANKAPTLRPGSRPTVASRVPVASTQIVRPSTLGRQQRPRRKKP